MTFHCYVPGTLDVPDTLCVIIFLSIYNIEGGDVVPETELWRISRSVMYQGFHDLRVFYKVRMGVGSLTDMNWRSESSTIN
ncbi:MAG: hypothetical protein GY801_03695 [bacterium]|nr:hypothetical protein [bacterium]